MKPLILSITKRLIEKTTIEEDSFRVDVSVSFIANCKILEVILFDENRNNFAYYFDNSKSDKFLKWQYKKVLKLINRRVIE